jgi:tetratricopeptide (TPR) repeat protein
MPLSICALIEDFCFKNNKGIAMDNLAEGLHKQLIIAQEAYDNKEYDKAINIFAAFLKICHDSSELTSLIGSHLGLCYLEKDEPLSALLILKNCPLSDEFEITLKYLHTLGSSYMSLLLYDFAIETYQKLLNILDREELKEEIYFELASAYLFINQTDVAIATVKEGLSLNPSWNSLKFMLYTVYRNLKDKQRAIAVAGELKSAEPSLSAELIKLIEQDNLDELSKKETEEKREAEKHYLSALEMIKHGEKNLAVNELIEAITCNKNFANAYTMLGCIYDNCGLLDEGLNLHRRAITVDAKCALAFSNMGYVYQIQGDTEGALSAYKKALEIDPDLVQAHNSVGVLYDNLGDYEKGISHFLEAYRIEPGRLGTLNNLGYAYTVINKKEEALIYLIKAAEIDRQSVVPKLVVANLYREQGLFKEAEDEYLAAIGRDLNSVDAWLQILRFYCVTDNQVGQLKAFQAIDKLKARDHGELFLLAEFYDSVDEQISLAYWQEYVTLAEELSLDPKNVALAQKRVSEIKKKIN